MAATTMYCPYVQAAFDYSKGFRVLSYTLPVLVWGVLSGVHTIKAVNVSERIAEDKKESGKSPLLGTDFPRLSEKRAEHIAFASFYGAVSVLAGVACYFNYQAIRRQ